MAKFDKQAYLLSYFDDISEKVQDLQYDYVYCLNTNNDYSFPTTLANLTNRSELEPFVKLKTHQYNSLIPKIRLYRIDYDNQKDIIAQKQFVFKKDYKYDVVSMTKPIVRDNCGIKSINWKLAGSNPVSAEKQVEVEIQMYFDSINAFSGGSYDSMISAWTSINKNEIEPFKQGSFKFCESETTTTNYWSLLFHPQTDKSKYDTFRFRIKAEVGWEDIGENIRSQLGISSDTVDIIKKLNYTFFLNLVKHQFTLNEDGSLQVTANYIASFESTTHNQQFDILGDLKTDLENLKTKTLTEIISQAGGENTSDVLGQNFRGISDLEKSLSSLGIDPQLAVRLYGFEVQQLSGLSNLANALTNKETLATLEGCSGQLPSSLNNVISSANTLTIEKQAQVYNAINNEVSRIIERASKFVIKKYYSAFIEKLLAENYYGIRVSSDNQTKWSNWYSGADATKPNISAIKTSSEDPSSISDAKRDAREELNNNVEEDSNNISELSKVTEEPISNPSEEMIIVFTTFGSIIDTAYNLIEENISISGENVTGLLNELKRIKVILSNISDEDQIFKYNVTPKILDTSEKSNIRNLAFAPIEINILKSFLIENIVRPQKTSYTLYSFLKDALSTLVIAGVNSFGQKNNETDKYANISLGSNLVTLGDGRLESLESDPLADITIKASDSSIIEASKLTIDNLSRFYIVPDLVHDQYYTYFIMYDKTLKDFKPKNDPIEDAKQNVYHYTYGQDYGLIKAINFTKIDQPYLKEAKAVGKKTFFLGQFRDVYNADLTMIGNNIYYPGMMLYIRPSVETSIGGNIPSFSQVTGIGGYYFVTQVESSITEDGYETKLKTIWHSDGYEPSENAVALKERCIAYLKEIGLISDGNGDNPLNTLVTIINNQTTKQALEEENKLLVEELIEITATPLNEGDSERRTRANNIVKQIEDNNQRINKK